MWPLSCDHWGHEWSLSADVLLDDEFVCSLDDVEMLRSLFTATRASSKSASREWDRMSFVSGRSPGLWESRGSRNVHCNNTTSHTEATHSGQSITLAINNTSSHPQLPLSISAKFARSTMFHITQIYKWVPGCKQWLIYSCFIVYNVYVLSSVLTLGPVDPFDLE